MLYGPLSFEASGYFDFFPIDLRGGIRDEKPGTKRKIKKQREGKREINREKNLALGSRNCLYGDLLDSLLWF